MCVWCRRPTRRPTPSSVPSPPKWKVLPSPTRLMPTLDFGTWLITLSHLRFQIYVSSLPQTRTNPMSTLHLIYIFGLWHGNCAQLMYTVACEWDYFIALYHLCFCSVEQGGDSFFVLTNMVVTPQQTQSRCPEVSDNMGQQLLAQWRYSK